MPKPMPAMTMRSLAGTAPLRPRAEARMMEGKAAAPATAKGAFLRNSRRFMRERVFISFYPFRSAG